MCAGTVRRQWEDGVSIHAYRRQPDGKPGALVQIAHGLADGNLVIDALVVVRTATLISLKPCSGSLSRIRKCWLLRGSRVRFVSPALRVSYGPLPGRTHEALRMMSPHDSGLALRAGPVFLRRKMV